MADEMLNNTINKIQQDIDKLSEKITEIKVSLAVLQTKVVLASSVAAMVVSAIVEFVVSK
jgi:prefoldin subunit 5